MVQIEYFFFEGYQIEYRFSLNEKRKARIELGRHGPVNPPGSTRVLVVCLPENIVPLITLPFAHIRRRSTHPTTHRRPPPGPAAALPLTFRHYT
jgi:hypothetical protein